MKGRNGFTLIASIILIFVIAICLEIIVSKAKYNGEPIVPVETFLINHESREIKKSPDYIIVNITKACEFKDLSVCELQDTKDKGWILIDKSESSKTITYLFGKEQLNKRR